MIYHRLTTIYLLHYLFTLLSTKISLLNASNNTKHFTTIYYKVLTTCFIIYRLTLIHFVIYRLTLFHFIIYRLTLFHFIIYRLTLFHFIIYRLTLFQRYCICIHRVFTSRFKVLTPLFLSISLSL